MKRGAAVFAAVTLGLGACGPHSSPETVDTLPPIDSEVETPTTQFKKQMIVWEKMPGQTPAEKLGALDSLIIRCGSEVLLSTKLSLNNDERAQYDHYYSIINSVSNTAIQTYCSEL